MNKLLILVIAVSLLGTGCLRSKQSLESGRTWVVNNRTANASDDNPGSNARPLKTIQAAADHAQPGDTIMVREGVYREQIIPPRGGTSGDKPIVYKVAPGETVSIRGSEQISSWQAQGEGVWRVELDTSFFKGYNPFAIPVAGEWLSRVKGHRLGDVYCNGEALCQKMQLKEMKDSPNTWYTDLKYGYANKFDFPTDRQYPDGKIQIWANFGEANPNREMTEINARACAIYPEKTGLKHIVIDGFDIRHTAPQWSDIYTTEYGAIGTRYGYGWTIQNCTIRNSRNVGISLGVTDEVHFARKDEGGLLDGGNNIPPLDTIGHHLIRNNRISRCGQTGIYGCYGAVACVIEGNVITETNYRKEWFGPNQAAIKILFPIDTIIRNNLCIAAPGGNHGTRGIWLDWGAQNTRVTGNVIYDFGAAGGLFCEVNFGPIIVDNNVIARSHVLLESNGCLLAHNLFSDCIFRFWGNPGRTTPYYKPHSTKRSGKTSISLLHNRIYNNIIIGREGLVRKNVVRNNADVSSFNIDHNIYLNGAGPFPDKDKHCQVITERIEMELNVSDRSATLKLNLPKDVFEGECPLITSKMIGKVPLAEMHIEHPDGQPLNITTDYFGRLFDSARVLPGPFRSVREGENTLTLWPKKD
jgi:alpha-N-arabinofuranosidase